MKKQEIDVKEQIVCKDVTVAVLGEISSGKSRLIGLLSGADEEDSGNDFRLENQQTGLSMTLVEADGRPEKKPKMAALLLRSDAVLMTVSLAEEENTDFSILESMLELVQYLGLEKRLLFVLNKIDHGLVEYSHEKVKRARKKLCSILRSFSLDNLQSVVTSALNDENVMKNAEELDSVCLKERLLQLGQQIVQEDDNRPLAQHLPLRLSIKATYKKLGIGTIAMGNCLSGAVKVGDTLSILPGGRKATVKSIQRHRKEIAKGERGQIIAVSLKGISRKEVVKGSLLAHPDSYSTQLYNGAIVKLHILYTFNGMFKGFKFNMLVMNRNLPCVIVKVLAKASFDSPEEEEDKDDLRAETGSIVTAKVRFEKPVYLERYNEFPSLGQFIFTDSNINMAYGTVEDLIITKEEITDNY